MPFCFEARDVLPEVESCKSVLVVPCRFCPAASMAVKKNERYIEFPRRGLKTASYERQLAEMENSFEKRGIKTSVFKSRFLHQFVLCMWTGTRREKLAEVAKSYDALVVIGCEAAVDTVRAAVDSSECQVVQGVKTEGLMSIQPRFSFTGTVRLELEGISPTTFPEQRA